MKWAAYSELIRRNPKEALEADLVVAAAGAVIAFVGGALAVAGFQPPESGNAPATPAAGPGNVIFWIGVGVIALGLLLMILNVAVFVTGRRGRGSDHPPEEGPVEPR